MKSKTYILKCFCIQVACLLIGPELLCLNTTQAAQSVFVFLAPNGAGKSTIAAQCAQELGFLTISTGYLCRSRDDELGRLAVSCMKFPYRPRSSAAA